MAKKQLKELIWAAGFFDGEGSISCSPNNGKPNSRLQLSIGQKNYQGQIAPTLLRFHEAVGVGHIYHKAKTGKEINQHQFLACKLDDVRKCVNLLWPFLTSPKRAQIERAFTKYYDARNENI